MNAQVVLAHCRMLSASGFPGQPIIQSEAGNASTSVRSQAQHFLELPTFLLPFVPQDGVVEHVTSC